MLLGGACAHGPDLSSKLVTQTKAAPLLFKIVPLSCIQLNPCNSCSDQNEDFRGVECAFEPNLWGPVTSLSIEGDTSIRSSLLFQAAVTLAAAGDSVVYITSAPLQALPPPVHGMPVPASDSMHRVRFIYLPSAESVLNYLASLHLSSSVSSGRHPDAILLDAPAIAPAAPAAPGTPAASWSPSTSPLPVLARLRAALEEAALTVSAVSPSGRCAVLMASAPGGGRLWRPPDRHTARLLSTGPDTLQMSCGALTCLLTASSHCLRLRNVSVAP